jgi:Ion channel
MTNFSDFFDLAIGSPMLIFIITIHGFFLRRITDYFSRNYDLLERNYSTGKFDMTFIITIWLMLASHLIEALLWSLPMYALAMFPSMRIAFYFAAQTYTTLGMGDVVLPAEWRLLGPIIAISGLFTFGWTGSVLVVLVGELSKLRVARYKGKSALPAGEVAAAARP